MTSSITSSTVRLCNIFLANNKRDVCKYLHYSQIFGTYLQCNGGKLNNIDSFGDFYFVY